MRYFLLVLDLASRYIILFWWSRSIFCHSLCVSLVSEWVVWGLVFCWFSEGDCSDGVSQETMAAAGIPTIIWLLRKAASSTCHLHSAFLSPSDFDFFFFFPPHFFSVLSSFLMAQVLYGIPASDSLTCNLFSFWNSRSQICGKSSSTLP